MPFDDRLNLLVEDRHYPRPNHRYVRPEIKLVGGSQGDILQVALLVRQVEGTVKQRLQLLCPAIIGDTNDRNLQSHVSAGFCCI